VIVTCARCLAEWPEGDPAVVYANGDWWCHDEVACSGRYIRLLEVPGAI
jgi:hypothetical protein